MRNVPFTSNVGGCELIGVVKNGKKFPYGTVSEETYNADMQDVAERIQNVGEVAEHAVNAVGEVDAAVDALKARTTNAETAIQTNAAAIAAVQTGLASQVTKEAADVAALDGKINLASSQITGLTETVTAVRADVTAETQRLNNVENSLSALITEEAGDIAALEAEVAEAVQNFNTSIASATSTLTASINSVNTALGTRIDDLAATERADIAAVNQSISTNIATVNAAISEANADIADLSARHTTDINAANARIDTVNAGLNTVNARVEAVNTSLASSIVAVESQLSAEINAAKATETADKQALETSIAGVSQRVTDTNTAVTNLQTQHVTDVNAINSRIDTTNDTLAVARADIADVSSDLDGLSGTVDARFEAVNRRIDELSGDDVVEIRSFTATPNVCEKGGTENVLLQWIATGNIQATKINNTVVTGNTYTATVTDDTTFTLEVFPEKGVSAVKTVDVIFANHIFWGVSNSAAMDEGAVKALDFTELSEQRARTFDVVPNRQYVYYAYPKRLGASVFMAEGFEGGFTEPATVAIDNHAGFTEDYYVYRTENKISGTTEITVR